METPAEIVQRCIDLTAEARGIIGTEPGEVSSLLLALTLNLTALALLLDASPT